MPIRVTCTGCHARFDVSEKFAGKEGPVPKMQGDHPDPGCRRTGCRTRSRTFGSQGFQGAVDSQADFPQRNQAFRFEHNGRLLLSIALFVGGCVLIRLQYPEKEFDSGLVVGGRSRCLIALPIARSPPIRFCVIRRLNHFAARIYGGGSGICSAVYAALFGC